MSRDSRRERWLKSLDRRFFRERYDAQRLLKNIAEQISRASSFDAIVPLVVTQIDEALHPEFVDVLKHAPGETVFTPVTGGTPQHVSEPLPSSFTVIGLLSVLGQPLALSLGDTAWVRHQLPAEERTLLTARGIELLVPIVSQVSGGRPVALLVLGPRRSEEPYNEEDLDLLGTIAHALGLLMDRPSTDAAPAGLAECESCGRCFDGTTGVCVHDSQRLTPVRGARVLNGRYRLDRRLGRGGMGAVYAAVDEALERPVAVKLIRDDLVGSVDLNTRFRHEARAAAGFAHPHVVRVYDFGVDRDASAFLVMELLEGQTLRQRLAPRVPLDRAEVLHILRGVCSAISAAHTQGLVHRDLKPENIFLQRHENGVLPKVLDFGLAKAFGAQWPHDRAKGTDAGVLVGTLEYMAPEQAAGDVVSPAWDIWALGVITHEMLTGHHPFRRSVEFGLDERVTTDPGRRCRRPMLPDARRRRCCLRRFRRSRRLVRKTRSTFCAPSSRSCDGRRTCGRPVRDDEVDAWSALPATAPTRRRARRWPRSVRPTGLRSTATCGATDTIARRPRIWCRASSRGCSSATTSERPIRRADDSARSCSRPSSATRSTNTSARPAPSAAALTCRCRSTSTRPSAATPASRAPTTRPSASSTAGGRPSASTVPSSGCARNATQSGNGAQAEVLLPYLTESGDLPAYHEVAATLGLTRGRRQSGGAPPEATLRRHPAARDRRYRAGSRGRRRRGARTDSRRVGLSVTTWPARSTRWRARADGLCPVCLLEEALVTGPRRRRRGASPSTCRWG